MNNSRNQSITSYLPNWRCFLMLAVPSTRQCCFKREWVGHLHCSHGSTVGILYGPAALWWGICHLMKQNVKCPSNARGGNRWAWNWQSHYQREIFFTASLEKNPATWDAVRNSSLLHIQFWPHWPPTSCWNKQFLSIFHFLNRGWLNFGRSPSRVVDR